ncbi:MAG TPA: helix-turn-helix domain-containing protein [Burkholderiaceae bacterium]|nr:helix-turn-helix domain-containing protein [Burkholderiaceae bacterium]
MNTTAAAASSAVHEHILDTAERLFYAQGIQRVGVDAVVAAAGISKRTLYKHFGSREQLVAAYLERRAARQPAPAASAGAPLQEILGVFERLERWFGSGRFRGCPFSNAIAELGGDPAHPALAVARGVKAQHTAWFESQLRRLQVSEPARTAMQLSILVEGALAGAMQRSDAAEAVQVARAAQAAAKVLLHAAGAAGCAPERAPH